MPPSIYVSGKHGERQYDIFSRFLSDRVIWISGPIDEMLADNVVASLMYLQRQSNEDITIYINSPGGYVVSGLSIYDAMKSINNCVLKTRCIGQAASMAVPILSAGTKGERKIYPNARVMVHQPSGGYSGVSKDVEIYAEELKNTRNILNSILAKESGRTKKELEALTERDTYMGAKEAIDFGFVDRVWK